ncbi:quinone-dependent dihydroorotate dehydrogenase [Actinotalea sp. M2MS4P-6]|uniref:quinone-dependent dihydroorotate dehydrogenase n=1 Tax=Actinotalea sp. M2MS4P-6 TaxID=2983762 RepID=UPI0021E3EF91|nr:quinone-dependent dihydroorotate dehydrogenase [Actinotalea sp. M2MS4P-6]MCV2396433.1 quinone-dependent dihydroorotate dehydrogenase [Actinotalea sp. M2MS4P-6]
MYALLFRVVFRRMDPEAAHHWAFALIRFAARVPVLSGLLRRYCAPAGPPVHVLGRAVPGRLGLAAGFDKDATGVVGMTMLGFAFVEVGTITPVAQPGNEPPRLWRVLEQRALRNRMGFNNQGAAAAAARLRRLRSTPRGRELVVGVNIGKNKVTPAERAADDYAACAKLLAPWADFLVVNVSSPNTPGLRDLQSVDSLRPLLVAARSAADSVTDPGSVPLLVKIAPDLADDDVLAVADLVTELDLSGVVAVNTTIAHDLGEGGLSGPPLLDRGVQVVRLLRERLGTGRTIIGVGGVTTGADARAYVDAGADLVEGYTGLIYEGPFWAARVHRGLAEGA